MEGAAGAFLDHVRIQAFRPHQRDTPIKRPAFIRQARKLAGQVDFLGFQFLKSMVAVVAFNGVVAEIAEKQETHGRYEKRPDLGLFTLASRHEPRPHPDTEKTRGTELSTYQRPTEAF